MAKSSIDLVCPVALVLSRWLENLREEGEYGAVTNVAIEQLIHTHVDLAHNLLVCCVDGRVGAAMGLFVEAYDVEEFTQSQDYVLDLVDCSQMTDEIVG